jgi:hypothetical protein
MPNTNPAANDLNGLAASRRIGEGRSYVDFAVQAATMIIILLQKCLHSGRRRKKTKASYRT